MVSLLRLINHNGIFRNDKFCRIIDHFRKPQFRFEATKAKNPCACPEPPDFVIRLALPKDYLNALSLLCCTYFKNEPSIVNIGLGDVPPSTAMLNMTLAQIKDGMTLIAVNPAGYIIGAVVNVGACPWDPKKMMQYAKCCEVEGRPRELLEFFAYLADKPDVWNRYSVRKVFECGIVAVDSEYRGQGIAKKLVEESWYLARDCGYRLFRIDCSSRYTAKLAEGFGMEKICTIPYYRYVKNGELVFKNIKEPHTEVEVYVDRVNFYDTYTLPYKSKKT